MDARIMGMFIPISPLDRLSPRRLVPDEKRELVKMIGCLGESPIVSRQALLSLVSKAANQVRSARSLQ